MNLLIAILLIAFEATFEGFKLRKWHVASEIIEFVYLTGVTFIIFGWYNGYIPVHSANPEFWLVLFGYVFMRFAIFDFVFNMAANQSLFYVGKTKLFDKLLSKLGAWVFVPRLIAFGIGLSWLCGWRYGINI